MNVMAIGAHPDDIEFGCSGTLIKHKERGDTVVYVCMTSTESKSGTSGNILRSLEQLKSEVKCSTELIECDYVEFAPFTDLHVPFNFESVSVLDGMMQTYKIDTVYTHWAGDSNQDHIATYKATMAAARYVPNVFCYEQIPLPRHTENEMNINYYNDITGFMDAKIEVAKCHKSQIKKYGEAGFDVPYRLKILAEYRGIQANCKYAEGFHLIKKVEK
jgi:LmbE family N-acetylglucosaminyl deacetylase